MMFRKKPAVIDAWMWDGTAKMLSELQGLGMNGGFTKVENSLVIHTPEGNMLAGVGDWIIRGIAGEFYPCNPEIFEATYEPVPE